MHIFQELLLESGNSFSDRFKAIYAGQSTAREDQVKAALDTLETAVKADTIYNVDFNEVKDRLSRSLETALRFSLDSISHSSDRDNSPHLQVYMADISSYIYLNQAKGQVKKIKEFLKTHTDFPAADKVKLEKMLAANEAAAEINEIMTKLKPKIVKGRRPNLNVDPNKFQSKLGSAEAQKLVREKLEHGVKEPLDQYEKNIRNWIQNTMDGIAKEDTYTVERGVSDPFSDMIFFKAFKIDRDATVRTKDSTTYKIEKLENPDYAKTEAKDLRDGIELRYLAKNIKKLSHVVDLKGNLLKIEELENRKPVLGSGEKQITIESGFKFLFGDNSEFKVVNKIVTKYSYSGKRFEQFPTTFHDVKFPDGTSMKSPSEEKMVTVFGKTN